MPLPGWFWATSLFLLQQAETGIKKNIEAEQNIKIWPETNLPLLLHIKINCFHIDC